MFNNLINMHDFVRLFEKISDQGFAKTLNKIFSRNRTRVEMSWEHTSSREENWWDIPLVQERWNLLITGDRKTSHYSYVAQKYLTQNSPLKAISLGCGSGTREVEWAKTGKFSVIDCYDLSSQRIESATKRANDLNLKNILTFKVASIYDLQTAEKSYDVVIAEGILHHLSPVRRMLLKIQAMLKDEGYLIVNEFVGPSRFQWSDRQLEITNGLLSMLQVENRVELHTHKIKRRVYRPGRLSMMLNDPSEAAESSCILPLLHEMFNVVEEKPYGGTILHLLLKDIAHHFSKGDEKAKQFLQLFFAVEDFLLKNGDLKSDFTFLVCKNRK